MKLHQILLLHIATSILALFPSPIYAQKMMYQDSIEIVVHRGANLSLIHIYWQVLQDQLDGKLPVLPVGNSSTPTADNPAMTIDWYALEEQWTLAKNTYAASAEGDCIEVAKMCIRDRVHHYRPQETPLDGNI